MDTFTLFCISKELNKEILNSRINKIYEPERYIFSFYLSNKKILIFSLKRDFSAIFIYSDKLINPEKPTSFCMKLRKHIQNGFIFKIEAIKFYRIIEVHIKKGENTYKLHINLSGKFSNILLLTDENEIIINYNNLSLTIPEEIPLLNLEQFKTAIKEEKRLKGFPPYVFNEILYFYKKEGVDFSYNYYKKLYNYEINCQPAKLKNKIFPFSLCHVSEVMEKYSNFSLLFSSVFREINLSFIKKAIIKEINKKIIRLKKTISKIRKEIKEKSSYNTLFKFGELLKANIHSLKKGMEFIEVNDFYSESFDKVKIKLDKKKSPVENIEYYFKIAKKSKRGLEKLQEREKVISEEIKYLEGIIFFVENSEDIETLISEYNFFTNKSKKTVKTKKEPYKKYCFENNSIVAGKSNFGNDFILKKFGNPDFLWFHIKDFPGSHVIILEKQENISENVIQFAAKIALENSKAAKNKKGEVIYTPVKYVRKIKGAPPGMVSVDKFKTIFVTI